MAFMNSKSDAPMPMPAALTSAPGTGAPADNQPTKPVTAPTMAAQAKTSRSQRRREAPKKP